MQGSKRYGRERKLVNQRSRRLYPADAVTVDVVHRECTDAQLPNVEFLGLVYLCHDKASSSTEDRWGQLTMRCCSDFDIKRGGAHLANRRIRCWRAEETA